MKVRATFNNARSGKNGIFQAKHLDGPDGKASKMSGLLYTWHCGRDRKTPFEKVEADFYEAHFRAALDAQNERHRKAGNKSRIRTMDEYRTARNTCPESTLFYLGNVDNNAGPKVLQKVVVEFWMWRKTAFPQVKSLDLALHIEGGAPHIHERHVFIGHDKDGNEVVNQEAALREMGVKPPKPGKIDRFNNAKMTFTEICREKMIEIARSHGVEILTEPREAGKAGQSQAKYITQDEQRKAAEAREEASRIKAQAVQEGRREAQEITRAATEKLEHLTGAIMTAERELGDLTEYRAWRAEKAAQERQEAARKAREEQEARERQEAARKAQEAQERQRQEQETRKAAQAAQKADKPKTREELLAEAKAKMLKGTAEPPRRPKLPSLSPMEQLQQRTAAEIKGGREGGPRYPGFDSPVE